MMESKSQPSDASEQVRSIEEKSVDPMEVFRRQLEDIINTYGSADSLIEEKISSLEKDEENPEDESVRADAETSSSLETEHSASLLLEALGEEVSVLLQSLNTLPSKEEKVEMLLRKYAELLKKQRNEQVKLMLLQKKQGLLVEQRDRLQLEHSRGILARSELEKLCRNLHQHNTMLKEDMLEKCQEDERKCTEIHSHFHNTVVDIQAQIEQHSSRNNKLSQENIELANKLTSIIQQYEKREESWEKIFKQKELQQQLSDAKLEEANLRLREEEEKHKREKEYLLIEAIDKTKKCFTLKEQELKMKKQLVMYSQKFEEFQATLAKSNEVYAVFKQEMEKMTTNMKKLEKEANMWRTRFENCNKALTEMIEERSEKSKELELFTQKIDKLEMLCRALQEERKVLYDKIKEIRLQTVSASTPLTDITEEIPDIEQLPVLEPLRNPPLIAEMDKLWKEQEHLQAFAASLLVSTAKDTDASDSEKESSEPKPPVPAVPEEEEGGIKGLQKSDTALTPEAAEAIQLESNQQEVKPPKAEPPKAEPPEAEPPKVEPPKAEPPKAESHKVEPPKAEPPKVEPPKAEPPKVELPKAEPPKAEPPKAEPPKVEPPKVEPPKAEPPKAESPKVEPPKVEPPKAEPPKVEPPKAEPPKVELPKAEPPKAEPPKAEPPKVEPPKAEPPKAESPKAKPPKVEPPKAEPPKAEPPKVEPPKAEPPKAEPPKVEPPKAEPPKAESPKAEPPKVEPPKAEPPKAESPKAEPPKVEPPKAEPPKAEPPKAEPPKEEPPKEESQKAEPLKDKLPKVPNRNDGEVKPNQQNKHTQKANKPISVEHKEPQPEVETPTAQAEAPQAHTQQEPRAQSTKQASGTEAEPKTQNPEPQNPKPQNPETQEPKAAANKPQGKKQGSSKKRGAAKGVKKS